MLYVPTNVSQFLPGIEQDKQLMHMDVKSAYIYI